MMLLGPPVPIFGGLENANHFAFQGRLPYELTRSGVAISRWFHPTDLDPYFQYPLMYDDRPHQLLSTQHYLQNYGSSSLNPSLELRDISVAAVESLESSNALRQHSRPKTDAPVCFAFCIYG